MNRKGNALAIVAVILSLTILAIYIINVASRECKSNQDCPDSAYCGSDFACHQYPKEVIVAKNNLVWPAAILGISLVAAAYIYRGGKARLPA